MIVIAMDSMNSSMFLLGWVHDSLNGKPSLLVKNPRQYLQYFYQILLVMFF